MNNIAINSTVQTFTASRKTTSAKTDGSDFGIALQSSFSYSEARGVNAIASNALEMLDDELEDMYVVSNSHKIQLFHIQIQNNESEEYLKLDRAASAEASRILHSDDYFELPLGENELASFIEDVRNGINDGKTLEDVINAAQKKHPDFGYSGNTDKFFIDKNTGNVGYSFVKPSCHNFGGQGAVDFLTVMAIADDISTVLRYTYFAQEGDDSLKVSQLLSGISERSKTYDVDRFNPLYDTSVDHPNEWYIALEQKLNANGAANCDSAIDSLLELLDRHFKAEQQREAENDDFGSSSLTVAAMATKIAVSKSNEASALAM